ncbi:MAG: PEP-CTERM sorting domain-containing protein [Hyphomicrobiales bacterium]|nr:PEP-CTERM sorting domain-containing protein [Hyphomicrobiales bacterium]
MKAKVLTVLALMAGLLLPCGLASAATITFDGLSDFTFPGVTTSLTASGFEFALIDDSQNCPNPQGSCSSLQGDREKLNALNHAILQVKPTDGSTFDLLGFDLTLLTANSSVRVTAYLADGSTVDPANVPIHNVLRLVFTPSAGNVAYALDNINVTSAVPVPGALPLFATGLGALGFGAWRRKRSRARGL